MIIMGDLVGLVMLTSLVFYALGGGADFGAGLWNLFAFGPRAQRQRELIAHVMGPIWEANHVWLILFVVVLFVAFPPAFAAISTALNIPLTAMLVGIVLRGTAFVFRNCDVQSENAQRRWNRFFAVGSIVAPLMLGVCVGAIASGRLRVDLNTGHVQTDFISQWLSAFPFSIGLWTLALFAFLAAVYLTNETGERDLQEDFRRRALIAGAVVAAMALASFILSDSGAPLIHAGLGRAWWSIPFHIWTGVVSVGAMGAVWLRKYRLARPLAMAQIALILCGWGFAQFPYLVGPDLTLRNAAAPESVLRVLLVALALGALLLFPSLWYLFQVFKTSENKR
jgi:cytochrome bd ubiquinol oxidase subunit II